MLCIQKNELFNLIQKAYPVIPLKTSLQILNNFKIIFKDNIFEVSATDLDQFIKVKKVIENNEEFEIAVNAKKIFEIIKETPDGIITLEKNENNIITIKSEKGFFCRITGNSINEFPGFPQEEEIKKISVSKNILNDLIEKSIFATAKDDTRSVLSGVLFERDKENIGMVSTDGHRLGCSYYKQEIPQDKIIRCIISPKTLINLSTILKNENEEFVNIEIGEKYIFFRNKNITICSKLIEGQYPEYRKVIPKNNPKIAIIEKIKFKNAVKRVSILSNQKTHLIKLNFSNNNLEISVSNKDIGGEAKEEIDILYENDQHNIGFNSNYLLEILDLIKTEKIKMEMNTQISGCLIMPYYEKDKEEKISEDIFLLMPLRIIEE